MVLVTGDGMLTTRVMIKMTLCVVVAMMFFLPKRMPPTQQDGNRSGSQQTEN